MPAVTGLPVDEFSNQRSRAATDPSYVSNGWLLQL
jgi:hypothetical protein